MAQQNPQTQRANQSEPSDEEQETQQALIGEVASVRASHQLPHPELASHGPDAEPHGRDQVTLPLPTEQAFNQWLQRQLPWIQQVPPPWGQPAPPHTTPGTQPAQVRLPTTPTDFASSMSNPASIHSAPAVRQSNEARSRISFKEEAETLTKFSGQDATLSVRNWVRMVDETARLHCWNSFETFFAAKRALTGAAAEWLKAEMDIQSWDDLQRSLVDDFEYEVTESSILKALAKKRPRWKEPLIQYVHRMRNLGKQGAVSERTIIEFITDGISCDAQQKISLYGCTNFTEFRKALSTYDAVVRKATEVQRRNDPGGRSSRTPAQSSGSKKGQTSRSDKCYNCGRVGYIERDCPDKAKGVQSYICHQPGHISRECKEKQRKQGAPRANTETINLIGEMASSRLHKPTLIAEVEVTAAIDSGAKINALRDDVWKDIEAKHHNGLRIAEYPDPLRGFGNGIVHALGKTKLRTLLDGVKYEPEYIIVPAEATKERAIIGDPLRDLARVILEQNKTIVEPLVSSSYVHLITQEASGASRALEGVPPEFHAEVEGIINGYTRLATEKAPVQMKIVLKDETPISRNPRRLLPREMEVDHQVEEWLGEEVIVPSCSEFASAVVVSRMKDGSPRICIDYKPINKVLVKERTPMPLIEDVLDELAGARVYSTIDLKNGFFHVPIANESRKYTSFVTPKGQYEFTVVPFGFSTSPAVFTRYVTYVFAELMRKKVILFFMDDGVVKGSTYQEALENLRLVLETAS